MDHDVKLTPTVNLHAAKAHLSRLVERAAAGEEIIIARAGKPVAKLVPLERSSPARPGSLRGSVARFGRLRCASARGDLTSVRRQVVRFLLDTHILIWALYEAEKLDRGTLLRLEDPSNSVFFSAVSIWEIAIKASLGRVDSKRRPEAVIASARSPGITARWNGPSMISSWRSGRHRPGLCGGGIVASPLRADIDRLLTVKEFLAADPGAFGDAWRYELIDGRVVAHAAPISDHSAIMINLGVTLKARLPPQSGCRAASARSSARRLRADLVQPCARRLGRLDEQLVVLRRLVERDLCEIDRGERPRAAISQQAPERGLLPEGGPGRRGVHAPVVPRHGEDVRHRVLVEHGPEQVLLEGAGTRALLMAGHLSPPVPGYPRAARGCCRAGSSRKDPDARRHHHRPAALPGILC